MASGCSFFKLSEETPDAVWHVNCKPSAHTSVSHLPALQLVSPLAASIFQSLSSLQDALLLKVMTIFPVSFFCLSCTTLLRALYYPPKFFLHAIISLTLSFSLLLIRGIFVFSKSRWMCLCVAMTNQCNTCNKFVHFRRMSATSRNGARGRPIFPQDQAYQTALELQQQQCLASCSCHIPSSALRLSCRTAWMSLKFGCN